MIITLLIAARALIVLGVLHVVVGLVQFRMPLREAIAEGFVGRFMSSDTRRLAFWFLLAGPLQCLVGQVAVHAIHAGDLALLRLLGLYLLGAAVIGVLAFPRSPLWALLLPSLVFVAAGFGWI